jgi:hypothetical protein
MRRLLLADGIALVHYAGEREPKFVSKDAIRFEAMVAGAMGMLDDGIEVENIRKVVPLGVGGTICRRNTLPRLHGRNFALMRCPLRTEETDAESSGSESSSES